MNEDEDFAPYGDGDDSEPSEEQGDPIPSGNPQIQSLQRQIANRDAIIQRLKGKQSRKVEAATKQAAEEAVELYKETQRRLGQASRAFEKAGYPGLARDFLALEEDPEPTPEAVEAFLAKRGLQAPQDQEAQTPAVQAAAANFHTVGGTSIGTGPMTWEEYSAAARVDPAGAEREAERRGLEKLGGIGEL